MTQRWWYQDQKCWHYYSAHCAWLGMCRSSSPRQGDPRYWRQLTVHGANLDQMISPQQRTHYLGKIFSPPSQARWKKTLHSPRQLRSQKEASERRKRPPFLARGNGKGMSLFFEGALLPSMEAGRARALPVQFTSLSEQRRGFQSRETVHQLPQARTEASLPRAKATTGPKPENPSEEVLRLLNSLPKSNLESLEIKMDLETVKRESQRPVSGRLTHFATNWEKISNDPWVQETISGSRLEFRCIPQQGSRPGRMHLDAEKSQVLSQEVENLAAKEAIQLVADDSEGYTSPIFLVPMSDGSWRPVINLKSLNRYVITHFKMESIRTVKGLMQRGDWLVKLDLKDAYLTVPIHSSHQKYLRFQWQGQTWEFKVLPFGLSSAPYTFSKLMKPVVSTLRKLGIRSILYLDDMLIMTRSKEEARRHLATAMELLVALGFIINLKKSTLSPTQELEFLGFLLNSHNMTIALPAHKLHAVKKMARRMANQRRTTLQELASLLGMMVAAHPAILPAPLHYRNLESAKSWALQSGHTYEADLEIDPNMESDLRWWLNNSCQHNGRPLQIVQWGLTIESDASKKGWGASCQGVNTGGPWSVQERTHHINYLELLAAFLALKSFASNRRAISILLRLDNITAIAFLNRMGGTHSPLLSRLAVEIWNWCIERNLTIHAEHHPGIENVRADWESRHRTDSSDWRLNRDVFLQLENKLGPFSIDMFASRTNAQLPLYCSWKPDPAAVTVDGLSISWKGHHPYMFPPFVLIPRCLSKLQEEKVTATLIAPVWPNQIWFPQLLRNLIDLPILLPPTQDIVTNPEGLTHPMAMKGHLPLAAWPVSGDPTAQKDFRIELSASSGSHGEGQLSQRIPVPGDNGIAGVLDRGIDPLSAPVRQILEFLYEQFEMGKQYRTINTLRSAISMTHDEVDGTRVGQHPLVSRFLKGVFNCRPPAPRYTTTWDVDVVLSHIKSLPDNEHLSFQLLTHKVVMLMALTNADRCSDLAALDLCFRSFHGDGVKFIIPGLTKTRRKGPLVEAFYSAFPEDPRVCPGASPAML